MGTAWYPLAKRVEGVSDGGEYNDKGPGRGVIHTTEGSYGESLTRWVKDYYHIEYKPLTREWRQNIPFDKAARSLRNPRMSPDTETNRNGKVCIQISIHARAANASDWSVETEDDLAAFIAWCYLNWGIEPVLPVPFRGSECSGRNSRCRLSIAEWEAFSGWCGHQHVTENTHWDPGEIDVPSLEEAIHMATLNEVLTVEAAKFWQGSYENMKVARNSVGNVDPARITSLKHLLENDRLVADAYGVNTGDEQSLAREIRDLIKRVDDLEGR